MGSRSMYKLDFCLIPFIYLFWLTLTILYVATLFVPTSYTIGGALKNSLTWTDIFILHPIIFVLSGLHNIVQIPIIQIPLNIVQQLSTVLIFLYWPKFCFDLLKHISNSHSVWGIITNSVPPEVSSKSWKPSNQIVCLNQNICYYSFYQVQGAHAHIN